MRLLLLLLLHGSMKWSSRYSWCMSNARAGK